MIVDIITYALRSCVTYTFLVLGGIIAHFLKKLITETTKRNHLLHESIRAILRNNIIAMYNDCIKKGYCPIYVKENIKSLAKPYRDMGGNGVADNLVKELLKMPTEKKGS